MGELIDFSRYENLTPEPWFEPGYKHQCEESVRYWPLIVDGPNGKWIGSLFMTNPADGRLCLDAPKLLRRVRELEAEVSRLESERDVHRGVLASIRRLVDERVAAADGEEG